MGISNTWNKNKVLQQCSLRCLSHSIFPVGTSSRLKQSKVYQSEKSFTSVEWRVKLLSNHWKGNFRIHVLTLEVFLGSSLKKGFFHPRKILLDLWGGPERECDANKNLHTEILEFHFERSKYSTNCITACEFWPTALFYTGQQVFCVFPCLFLNNFTLK